MEAERLGIDGWIRNEPDGGVVAHLEGPVDSIQTMIRGMWTGPRWCHVTNVEVEDATNHGYASFTTEY
jgi:acylphosphatase